ncbi:hypothetical protein B0H11DRAFT_1321546 [Mycena galericulata]|nr:hypothetical protein B0H11DRAFT_1321546 [Mycena galericulata]
MIESLPPPPPVLFLEVKTEPLENVDEDADEAWETATESDDEYHNESDNIAAAEGKAVTDEHSQSQPACADLLLITCADPQVEKIVVATSTVDANAPRVSAPGGYEAARAARISMLGRSRLLEVLATPLEVSITPMDILWWVLLVMLGAAVSVLWNRV